MSTPHGLQSLMSHLDDKNWIINHPSEAASALAALKQGKSAGRGRNSAGARVTRQLERAAIELQVYSRRYCERRSTYAPADHNDHTRTLAAMGCALESPDRTVWAHDGQLGLDHHLESHDPLSGLPTPTPEQLRQARYLALFRQAAESMEHHSHPLLLQAVEILEKWQTETTC